MRRLIAAAVLFLTAQASAQQRASAVFLNSPSPQLTADDSFKITGAAYDSNGAVIKNAAFTWSSSDTTAIAVDPDGTVHGVGLGWADVSANTTGARGTVRIQVVPTAIQITPANQTVTVGTIVNYQATVLDVNGQPMSNVAIQWRAYGPNAGTNNGIAIDGAGNVRTFGFGTYFIEAYYNYTVGSGPFIGRYFGNTLLTVLPPSSFVQKRLLDSGAARQVFQLRPRRGLISVNDSGQIAYTGSLEGFANAALVWTSGVFNSVLAASNPAELPGSNLLDIDDPAFNNNGEIATRTQLAPSRSALLFGAADGTPRMLLFDGSSGGGATNIRNFQTTRFSLNDQSMILFRADYQNIGSTAGLTGLFYMNPQGGIRLAVPAVTKLDGMGTTYTFDRDFGIANDGTILFFVTNGSSRALYRLTPDGSIARVVGTGDVIDGNPVTSLGNVAVGKMGQYAVQVFNGNQNLLLYTGDPASAQKILVNNYRSIYAISSSGEAIFYGDGGQGLGLYGWNGSVMRVSSLLVGMPSPAGDLYTQFDSAGVTAKNEIIAQARTANNLLMVVNAGSSATAKAAILFQTGSMVNAPAGPAFFNLILNSHTGNPMIKTGQYYPNVFEVGTGGMTPRLIDGDLLSGGWFYEGNQDVRRNADGDLIVATDESLNQVHGSTSALLAHFPLRVQGGTISTGFQVAASSALVAITGGTNFGPQAISTIQNGTAAVIAYLGTNPTYKTASPGGGVFTGSNDIGADDSGAVYASLRVSGGPDGLFVYSKGAWSTVVKVGDTYDGRPVTGINQIRVAGNACFALINTSGNVYHLARYQNGTWTDLISSGDAVPTGGTLNSSFGIGNFDVNRKGAVAAVVNGNGGISYVLYTDGQTSRIATDSDHTMDSGEYLTSYFQIGLNDDGRIFLTAINEDALMVLYEFDPVF
jgi:hypothetical protein